jgi:hypothetical protein
MRRHALWALYFIGVFLVVLREVRALEARSGIVMRWGSGRWSLWRSTLYKVTLEDLAGRPLLSLDEMVLLPSGGGTMQADGRAAWGELHITATPQETHLVVRGAPLPPLRTQIKIEQGRLDADLRWWDKDMRLEGTFSLDCQKAQLLLYEGPLKLQGDVQVRRGRGTLQVGLSGDKLDGKGDLEVDMSAGVSRPRLSGPLRVDYMGSPLRLYVQGEAGNLSVTAQ